MYSAGVNLGGGGQARGAGGMVAGANGQIQFNNGGSFFGASGNLIWNNISNILGVNGSVSVNGIAAIGASVALDIQGNTKALKLSAAPVASITTPVSGMITNSTNVPYFHNGTVWQLFKTCYSLAVDVPAAGSFSIDITADYALPGGAIPAGSSVQYIATITWRNTTTHVSASRQIAAIFKNVAGTVTQEGATQTPIAAYGDATLVAYTSSFVISGSAVFVRMTGTSNPNLRITNFVEAFLNI
jgi:hypothetical protein